MGLMWNAPSLEFKVYQKHPINIEFVDKIGIVKSKYPGPYSTIPTFDQQIFDTTDKIMSSDFTVESIQYTKQENTTGIEVQIANNATKTEGDVINKVVCGGSVLMDLSEDTADQECVAKGKYVHLANGQKVEGLAYSKVDNGILELTFGEVSEEDESMDVIY